ncbi:MAG: RNA methyltransferase [Betaproteobacteria bacterium HGW-Betaproteobacteria-22]|nr:MAG: RNA methyltransferase [Betaproteobacteria bacterium HGW-Betaproteobacteria-22]
MSFKHITSRDNPIFKQLKKFADNAKERRAEGKTLLDGVHLVESYVAIFGLPDAVIIPEGKSSVEATDLIQALADISTIMLPTLMFAELTPVASATGILALAKTPALPVPNAPQFVVMLEDIQDPGNLGSMLRTAAAAGADVAYLSTGCTDAWSPKALRGGQGAQFMLPIIERADLISELRVFQGASYATAMAGESIYAQNLTVPTAFVIGNEGAGLRKETMAACSKRITIPMAKTGLGSVESLNAGAATAICLFERVRQCSLKQAG